MTLIRFRSNYGNNGISSYLLNVLTLFAPKRSLYFLLFLIQLLAACGNPSEEISGIYETTITTTAALGAESPLSDTLPSDTLPTSDQGKTLRLVLFEDQRAELNIDFLNGRSSIVQKGSWELTENQRVKTYFVEKNGKFFRDTLSFRSEGLRLILRGKQNSISDEITLLKLQ